LDGVTDVKADMDLHTLTVSFDDSNLAVGDVVSALADAGYVAKDPEKLN
jgi:copper chaperone CopZ